MKRRRVENTSTGIGGIQYCQFTSCKSTNPTADSSGKLFCRKHTFNQFPQRYSDGILFGNPNVFS